MEEKRRHFIQRMENETVSPHDNGATKRPHGEDVIDLEEGDEERSIEQIASTVTSQARLPRTLNHRQLPGAMKY